MIPYLENRLSRRKKFGNLRQLPPTIRQLIDFSSNDYLGLARSSHLASCVLHEWNSLADSHNKMGSTGSRLLTGNSLYIQELEEAIAKFHRAEAGILFGCGYMANMGLLSAVGGDGTVVFFDAGVHASMHDGIRLSKSRALSFRHNDLEHLENRLKNSSAQGVRLICVESIYSTDGSTAPLPAAIQIAKKYDAHLIVDEAHALGVLGPNGLGLIAEHKLENDVFARVVTFGKALGTYGALVLGSHALKQMVINFARPFIYTTALPFPLLAAIKCSYNIFPKLEGERKHIQKIIQLFRNHCPNASMTQIQAIPIQGNVAVKEVAQKLMQHGFDVRPLMSPTVKRGHEILRICLHAFNTEEELAMLIKQITSDVRYLDA